MNKWYHPFGLLLLAAMLGNLSGCAQTREWLAKKPSKKQTDQEIAAAEKKLNEKTPKKKSSSELADTKSSKSKEASGKESTVAKGEKSKDKEKDKDVKTASATKSKAKAIDAEHEKFTAADSAKKKKPATDARADKEKDKDEIALAGSTKPAKPAAKPKSSAAAADDDLYSFVDKMDPAATKPVKKAAKPAADDDTEAVAETKPSARKNVVQVKKEVAKIEENDDIANWMDTETQPESKSVKSALVTEATEDEVETPFAESHKPVAHAEKSRKSEATHAWDEDLAGTKSSDASSESDASLFEEKPVHEKKMTVTRVSDKKNGSPRESHQGLTASCPQAEGELRDVLAGMDSADPESLKQGLHRIGQLGGNGRAAEPLLRKMLKHDDAFVRVHAALAMARLNQTTGESVAVVTASLKSRDASLRSFSVAVLDEMGPQASEVLESLGASLDDRDGQIRLRAAEVLIRHDEWSMPALQCLLACLTEKDENVRWLATYSFAELAPQSPEAVQALMKATGDPVSKVRVGAVYALGEIGPYAKRSGADLRRLMNSTKDEELKSAISYSLQQIEQ